MTESDLEALAYPPSLRAWYAVALLGLAVVIAYLDRQILFLLIEPIKAEMHLSDTQIGALQGLALGLFMAVAAIPLGRLADTGIRRRLIAISIVAWSAMTALSGLAQNYDQLFLCRIGVGIAEAGLAPAAYSLLADLFPPHRRVAANLVFYAVAFVGASAAVAIGGLALQSIELLHAVLPAFIAVVPPWRLLLMLLALPGPMLALLFFTLREPARQHGGMPADGAASRWDALRHVFAHRRLYVWLFASLLLLGLADNAIVTWLPTILVRSFDLPLAVAGMRVGMMAMVTSLLSFAVGYLLARRFAPQGDARGLLLVMQFGVAAALPAGILFVTVPAGDAALLLVAAELFGLWVATCLMPALLQAAAPNRLRGQISAIYAVLATCGGAIHPLAIGMLSDRVFVAPDGLRVSLSVVTVPALIAGVLALYAARRSYRQKAI